MKDYQELVGKTISKVEVAEDEYRGIKMFFTDDSAVYIDVELEGGALLTDGYFPSIEKL